MQKTKVVVFSFVAFFLLVKVELIKLCKVVVSQNETPVPHLPLIRHMCSNLPWKEISQVQA